MKRFKAREATGFKRYKFTPDDCATATSGPAYEQAACDMFERYRHRGCAVDPGEADNKRLPASKS